MTERNGRGREDEDASPAFDISPEVVFRLGDELITDELQALVELVKNSYDASATQAVVQIDTTTPNPELVAAKEQQAAADASLGPPVGSPSNDSSETPEEEPEHSDETSAQDATIPAPGWIEVRDNGDGMTRDRLDRGWLLISSSHKRASKQLGETNRLGRTPLGDKGLGRLGVLRLGLIVEIRTRPRDEPEEHILRFARGDFLKEEALSEIHPHYEVRPLVESDGVWNLEQPFESDVGCSSLTGRQGTIIRVTGLNEPEAWKDTAAIQAQMLALISPFEEINQFDLDIYVDDPTLQMPLPLGELAELRRNLADVRWRFDFDGKRLELSGWIKLRPFEPRRTNEELHRVWELMVLPDGGEAYRNRLMAGRLSGMEPQPEAAPLWMKVTQTVELVDLPDPNAKGRRKAKKPGMPDWVTPGPFFGELDSFDLSSDANLSVDEQEIFEDVGPYREWVRQVRGLRVYRDGFGVRVGEDFLRLRAGFTSGRSFWALRPGNVVGFLSISARANQQLQETTDREGFVVNAAYRTLEASMRWIVDRINLTQTEIGRELTDWAKELNLPQEPQPSRTADELAQQVAARADRTEKALSTVSAAHKQLQELGGGSALLTPEQERGAREATEVLEQLRDLVAEWGTLQQDLDTLARESRRTERERADLRDQVRVAYQTVGLGIVAETVAHEMGNITAATNGSTEYAVDPNAIPLGARVQYTGPIYDSWPEAIRSIAQALKTYGAYVNDRSGAVTIQGENGIGRGYNPWKDKIGDLTDDPNVAGTLGRDEIRLDRLDDPATTTINENFPMDKLRVLKIDLNTGQGTCPYPFP